MKNSSNSSLSHNFPFKIQLLLFKCSIIYTIFAGTYYYLDKPAPIPNLNFNINLDQIIDPQLIETIKVKSIAQYNSALNISSDYLLYLKSVVHSSAIEAKKIWNDNFAV